jgi:hypothetical protein
MLMHRWPFCLLWQSELLQRFCIINSVCANVVEEIQSVHNYAIEDGLNVIN